MSTAPARTTKPSSSSRSSASRRRLLMYAGAALLVVLIYLYTRNSGSSTALNQAADTTSTPVYDPSTGQWVDPTTGLPISDGSYVDTSGASGDTGNSGLGGSDTSSTDTPIAGDVPVYDPTSGEWVDSVTGQPIGTPGPQGPAGPAGPAGPSGAPGSAAKAPPRPHKHSPPAQPLPHPPARKTPHATHTSPPKRGPHAAKPKNDPPSYAAAAAHGELSTVSAALHGGAMPPKPHKRK